MSRSTHTTENPLTWAPDACSLPTAERPLRLADFENLFAGHLRSLTWPDPADGTRAQLILVGEPGLHARVQALADAESKCCSFFSFGVTAPDDQTVILDIEVPHQYADVLAALVARAETFVTETPGGRGLDRGPGHDPRQPPVPVELGPTASER